MTPIYWLNNKKVDDTRDETNPPVLNLLPFPISHLPLQFHLFSHSPSISSYNRPPPPLSIN